jgi:hypothetical protein
MCSWSKWTLLSPHEMVDAVQSDKAYHNKVESDDVVQQPWSNEDQNPPNKSDRYQNRHGKTYSALVLTARKSTLRAFMIAAAVRRRQQRAFAPPLPSP